jgi:hypothetical protein
MTTEVLGRKTVSIGDGVNKTFAIPFDFIASSDIRVYQHATSFFDPALATRKFEGTDFTITGDGRAAGASIVFGTAPGSGIYVTRLRVTSRRQSADYVPNDGFPAEDHETQLDRISLVTEELDAAIAELEGRAIRVPVGETANVLAYAADRKDKILYFNATTGQPEVRTLISSMTTVPPIPAVDIIPIGSFQSIATTTIPTAMKMIRTTEWRTGSGKGGAWYIEDSSITPATYPLWQTTSLNGRKFKLMNEQDVTIEMFGAYGDFDFVRWVGYNYQGNGIPYVLNTHFHDDFTAWAAAKGWIDFYKKQVGWNAYYKSVPKLNFGRAMYYFSDAIDIVDGMYQLIGAGSFAPDNGATTAIYSAAGKCGVICQSWDTTGVTGTTTNTPKGSAGSLIQDMSFFSLGGTIGTEVHGCLMKAPITLLRCAFYDYPGDGILVAADVTHAGNSNCWRVEDCAVVRNGRNGFSTVGGDSNAGNCTNLVANYNGIWGVSENSFLGNTHIGMHTAGNGKPNGSGPYWLRNTKAPGVRYSSKIYRVIPGQESGAATNAPTGTKLRNTWWAYVVDPPYDANMYPDWASGIQVRASGAAYNSGAANRSSFINAYMEHDQQIGWMDSPWCLSFNGLAGWTQGAQMAADLGMFRLDPGVFCSAVNNGAGGDGVETRVAIGGDMNAGTVFRMIRDKGNAGEIAHGLLTDHHDLYWCVNTDTAQIAYTITLESTTKTFGRATSNSAKHKIQFNEFFVGQGNAARAVGMGAAAPTTGSHAKGEIFFNDYSSATTPEYWRCTVAGTPGTWVSH